MAGIELQSGNVAEALKLLINALRINEQLVRLAPGNLQWLVDYISTLFGVGSLLSQSPETREHGTPLLQEAQRLAAALLNTEHGTTEQLQALAAAINNALTQFDTAKTVAGPGPNP